MTKRQAIILLALGLFVLLVIAAGVFRGETQKVGESPAEPQAQEGQDLTPKPSTAGKSPPKPVFTPEVPKNAKLSEPKLEAPASDNPELTTKMRFFDLSASQNGFTPSSITVNKGDTVQIDFTAVDHDYDLHIPYLGAYFSVVPKGTSKPIPFDVTTSGTFTFQCRNYCPDSKIIQGTLIVLP